MTIISTIPWLKQILSKCDSHEEILQGFGQELEISAAAIDHEAEPVNLCVFDGGGMKGYGIGIILEHIQEKCSNRGNLRDQFHLFTGASVGGVGALLLSRNKTINDFVLEGRRLLDGIREQSFTKIKKRKVWTKGRMVKQVHSIEEIIRARFGSEELLRPGGDIPACVLCAAQQHEDGKNGKKTIEPFVLRTYNYPPSSNGEAEAYMQDVNVREKHFTEEQVERGVVNSCSSATLAEAMAATTAVPMVYKPVKVNLSKGEQLDFADGVIFNESPVAIAISEARRLYPNRPLGVIMSIGLTSSTHAEEYTRRAIDIARQSHPNLYFHRIIPHEIIDKFHYLETDPDKVASFEEALRHFLHTNVATNDLLDNTIDKLFASNHHSHETTRKQEPSLSRMPSNSSTSTTRMFSTSSSMQSQNMVCDLNGWQGYEEQEDPDEMEEPSSIINVLLCCFRKKDNKQVPDTPGIQAQGITKDTKEEVSHDTTIKETNSFSPSEVSCGEQSDADSLSNDACLSVISLDDRFDHETWNDEA